MPPGSALWGSWRRTRSSPPPRWLRRDIAGAGDGSAFHTGLPNRARATGPRVRAIPNRAAAARSAGCHQCVGDDSIIRIDEQTDHGDLASCARCQSARDIRRNRTGRRWIEHQPGIVRPRRDGRIERLGVLIPQILIFAGMRSVGVLDQPHQRAVGIDQVADPQAARLQLRSFEARPAGAFSRLPPRSPMPPWHRDHPTAGNSRTSS
ncbi:hypothetical protein BANRA_05545 [Escherichia coli]|nr:hypothetical protein BANRA_05545 [Escherichia coli]